MRAEKRKTEKGRKRVQENSQQVSKQTNTQIQTSNFPKSLTMVGSCPQISDAINQRQNLRNEPTTNKERKGLDEVRP